jgi:hypothetical protein
MRTAADIDAIIRRDMLRYYGIREHNGWSGEFTTQQSALAKIANGARVEKIASEDAEAHPIGAMGTVLGSVGAPDLGVLYFIQFDASPRQAELIVEGNLAAIPAE